MALGVAYAMSMDLKTYLNEERGRASRLAAAMGVTQVTVHGWANERVPADRCPSIEAYTGAAVRCEDMRPDVDWAVLRCGCQKEAA